MNHPYPSLPLKGDNCQCRGCGELFRRTSTFTAHRYGPMTDRRCQTSMWMVGKGWAKDSKGFWKRGGPKMPIDRDDRRKCECGYGCGSFQGCRS